MHKLIKSGDTIGRCCIGVAMIAFGVQHLYYRDFVTRLVPKLPAWIPGHQVLACGLGVGLIAAGVTILSRKTARMSALLLGTMLVASFALLQLPLAAANPSNVILCVNSGKTLALAGSGFLIVGSLPRKPGGRIQKFQAVISPLEKFIPLAPYFLAAFFAYCGILHFIYVKPVADLVPAWIPGHIFWTYFSGVALVAGGAGMNVRSIAWLAARLSAFMIFVWVILLHIPRAVADLQNSNETTAVFEALAVAGAALLAATAGQRVASENVNRPRKILEPLDTSNTSKPESADVRGSWVAASHEQL